MKLFLLLMVSTIVIGCGPRGIQGSVGATGSSGADGKAAEPCNVQSTPNGIIVVCPDGSSRPVTNGAPGVDAPPVTSVQFCPQQGPTVYPTTFPEIGLCVSNRIYGTYWDRNNLNAWMAEVVPGVYQSTATGLGCTFTVLTNCGIQ